MKIWIMTISVLVLTSCQLFGGKKELKNTENIVSKTYFVQGMTCGGCIIGVKMALNKSDKMNIQAQNIEVGKATIHFKKSSYDGSNTDCEVTRTIEKLTDFKVYLDAEHKKRACRS